MCLGRLRGYNRDSYLQPYKHVNKNLYVSQFVLPSLSTCFGLIYVHLVASGYTNSQVSPIPGLMFGMACLTGKFSV